LVDEHGAVGFSYSTVRDYVRKHRPQILAEAGRPLELGYVPQTHKTAAEAEVDFHDLWVVLGCHSGFVVDEVVTQLDDKVNTLGGVPARM
jgi:hypothetical protein